MNQKKINYTCALFFCILVSFCNAQKVSVYAKLKEFNSYYRIKIIVKNDTSSSYYVTKKHKTLKRFSRHLFENTTNDTLDFIFNEDGRKINYDSIIWIRFPRSAPGYKAGDPFKQYIPPIADKNGIHKVDQLKPRCKVSYFLKIKRNELNDTNKVVCIRVFDFFKRPNGGGYKFYFKIVEDHTSINKLIIEKIIYGGMIYE